MDNPTEIYLNHLHSTISRLSSNSFSIKGWAATLTSGSIAVAIATKFPAASILLAFPILLFWAIDAYFLSVERCYRGFYESALNQCEVDTFSFRHNSTLRDWIAAFFSIANVLFYSALVSSLVFSGVFLVWFNFAPLCPQP